MDEKYVIPAQTRIGHVHLKVSDIKLSLEFYCPEKGYKSWGQHKNVHTRLG